jgi:hypothetical protein
MKPQIALLTVSFALTALVASPVLAADAAKPSTADQPNADAILREMSSKLAAARTFRFEAHRQIDAALLAGHAELPGDAQVVVTVLRPNKIAARSTSKGDVREFYADGRNLTLFDVKKNLYATVPMHTSLDGLVEELDRKYGFAPPLAEMAVSNVYEDIHWKAKSISYLGEATVPGGFLGLGGVACHRLALSGKVMDAELWVGAEDHLPRRLTVTTKGSAGKPQIKVEFSDWDLAAKAADQDFTFVPPKGAMKIPMRSTAEMAAPHKKH